MTENKDFTTDYDSIEFLLWLKRIWREKTFILRFTSLFIVLGFIVAILTKNVYTASTTFIPISQSGASIKGGFGGLASLAGISLGSVSNTSEISPALYPQILSSNSFKKELLNTKLNIEGQDSLVTYAQFYQDIYKPGILKNLKKYTIGLPSLLIKFLKGKQNSFKTNGSPDSLVFISNEEFALMELLDKQIKLSVNDNDGYISLSVYFPEPYAASELTREVQRLLQSYILNIKTKKSSEELDFLRDRLFEKEKEMNDLKIRLAKFRDENTSISTSMGKSKLFDLENEYTLSFDVFSELAKNVEKQRFQVKKDTPIFTILKPVSIPLKKSSPNRVLIFIIYSFVGFGLSVAFVIIRFQLNRFKNVWDSKLND